MGKGPKPGKIELSEEEERELGQIVKKHKTPQQIARRARVIQLAALGWNNEQIGREVGSSRDMARLWRNRWAELQHIPLKEMSAEAQLSDLPRSGAPVFSAEQVVQIIAIACEEPETSGYPVSHWTPKELVVEAMKRGIVESISERQVGRFLKRA